MSSSTAAARRPDPRPEEFAFTETEKVRFGDIDMLGHVNNVVFARYFETGRTNFFQHLGVSFDPKALREGNFAIVETRIRFVAELHYPASIDIATGVGRIGRSSVVLPQAIFRDGQLVAEAETVCVYIDMKERRAAPLPDDLRARLAKLQTAAERP